MRASRRVDDSTVPSHSDGWSTERDTSVEQTPITSRRPTCCGKPPHTGEPSTTPRIGSGGLITHRKENPHAPTRHARFRFLAAGRLAGLSGPGDRITALAAVERSRGGAHVRGARGHRAAWPVESRAEPSSRTSSASPRAARAPRTSRSSPRPLARPRGLPQRRAPWPPGAQLPLGPLRRFPANRRRDRTDPATKSKGPPHGGPFLLVICAPHHG